MPNPEIAPELIERMVALMRKVTSNPFRQNTSIGVVQDADAIVAQLPAPVDADLVMAREVAAQEYEGREIGRLIASGQLDHHHSLRLALAAIKRIRAEQANA